MSKIKPRGKVPKKAAIDEIIEIKTLIEIISTLIQKILKTAF